MPAQPRIHLVRHAQGFHNLGTEFHSLRDPRLTPLGESQCATLQATHFPRERQQNISLVTASPLTRTIHTAHLTFSPALANGKCQPAAILAIPDAQETSDYACDVGSEPAVLHALCDEQGWKVDLSLVKDDWTVKTLDSRYSPASSAIMARARAVRLLLRQKARDLLAAGDPAVEIVLVSHGSFLHFLTNDWEDADKLTGTAWENCEHRTYEFEDGLVTDADADVDPDAYFVETRDSRARRGKLHPMAPRDQQNRLFHKVMQAWKDQGLVDPAHLDLPLEPDDAVATDVSIDRASDNVRVMA
ncbi:hypothetical protein A1O3_02364 [Capronia epimyces CBS 606.96]|uniref:2,3-bisphosphoglycerate-dependent phosphoglycerate mutase n=1 Tax=Capronia epimyces CBS 606.96 TaxID=1182542 RepID=W9Y9U8_9EURO|nr:uncharacterized protein A1O3_02364 [Capronia epimyces CBS 606.96]EXJ89298.1 hypothetical protein A1O3_02364 [Capronia epimyces CBS 606.96]